MMFDPEKMTSSEWANLSCEDRIDQQMAWRIESLTEAIEAYESGECEDLPINTEALSIEYRTETVVEEQVSDLEQLLYVEIVLSWGGPADYLRMHPCGKIEYHFQDWGDGAWRYLPYQHLHLVDRLLPLEWAGNGSSWEEEITFNGHTWKDGYAAPEVWI